MSGLTLGCGVRGSVVVQCPRHIGSMKSQLQQGTTVSVGYWMSGGRVISFAVDVTGL